MQREFPNAPIAGVGAVVLDGAQRVLLVRRGQEPLQGEWSLPGGALELGERLEDGVRREVSEETGLAVEPVEIVAVFDHISHAGDDPAQVRFHYVLVDYRCRLLGGTLRSATDVTAARWASWNELTGHGALAIRPFTLSVIRKALDQVKEQRSDARESEIVTRDSMKAERHVTTKRGALSLSRRKSGARAASRSDRAPKTGSILVQEHGPGSIELEDLRLRRSGDGADLPPWRCGGMAAPTRRDRSDHPRTPGVQRLPQRICNDPRQPHSLLRGRKRRAGGAGAWTGKPCRRLGQPDAPAKTGRLSRLRD